MPKSDDDLAGVLSAFAPLPNASTFVGAAAAGFSDDMAPAPEPVLSFINTLKLSVEGPLNGALLRVEDPPTPNNPDPATRPELVPILVLVLGAKPLPNVEVEVKVDGPPKSLLALL